MLLFDLKKLRLCDTKHDDKNGSLGQINTLYIHPWCTIGINGNHNDTFRLTIYVKQGCPLASFFLSLCSQLHGPHDPKKKKKVLRAIIFLTSHVLSLTRNLHLTLFCTFHVTNKTSPTSSRLLTILPVASRTQINWHDSMDFHWVTKAPTNFHWGVDITLNGFQKGNLLDT